MESTDFSAEYFSLAFRNKRETPSLDENGSLISFYSKSSTVQRFVLGVTQTS